MLRGRISTWFILFQIPPTLDNPSGPPLWRLPLCPPRIQQTSFLLSTRLCAMHVNPKDAEEFELPEIAQGSTTAGLDDLDDDGLLRRSGSRDKLEQGDEGDEADDRPLLGGTRPGDEGEQIGKGTKIDDLIARVCIVCDPCRLSRVGMIQDTELHRLCPRRTIQRYPP